MQDRRGKAADSHPALKLSSMQLLPLIRQMRTPPSDSVLYERENGHGLLESCGHAFAGERLHIASRISDHKEPLCRVALRRSRQWRCSLPARL